MPGSPGVPGYKGPKGKTLGLDKVEDKIEDGIKSLKTQLRDCCDRNDRSYHGKRYAPYDEHASCPPYGKVCIYIALCTESLHPIFIDCPRPTW